MSKIYIVEDDKSIRTELAELLENAGYATQSALQILNILRRRYPVFLLTLYCLI